MQLLYIHIWLEDNEEDFVENPNYISEDDDLVDINDEDEEWTNYAILCYFDFKLFYFGSISWCILFFHQLNVFLSINQQYST